VTHSGMLGATPIQLGTYVVEVFHGWKLLEWHSGEWWHTERVGRWTAGAPTQWIGPLPPLLLRKKNQIPTQEFDL
jgi:hypothetical protein